MSDNSSGLGATPATLPVMTREEVKARAQRILDIRGTPPYDNRRYITPEQNCPNPLIEDELAVLSEFVQFWMPYLTIKEKSNGPQEKP